MREKIKTLIVDDEPLARGNLRALLKDDPEIELIGECSNGYEAIDSINAHAPDLVFLDIQMPELSGFEVLEKIETGRCPAIIFVTAYDQYALKAFEVHALDYLLKPYDGARFEKALQQGKTHLKQYNLNELGHKLLDYLGMSQNKLSDKNWSKNYLTRLMIKSTSRTFFLKVDEVDWIEADNYYVKLHVGQKTHLLRETMNELETQLDPDRFLRTHRSIIVNLDRIKELHPHFNGDSVIVLHDGTQVKLSRSRREHLQERLRVGAYRS